MNAHKKEEEKEEVTLELFKNLEHMVEDVATKMHRHQDEYLAAHEKIGDLETKVILLIQAAKNYSKGKDSSHLFDGIGDVVSAVDYLKESMKSQYAKLTEFKETEQTVEILNKFYLETIEEKMNEEKKREELNDNYFELK